MAHHAGNRSGPEAAYYTLLWLSVIPEHSFDVKRLEQHGPLRTRWRRQSNRRPQVALFGRLAANWQT